MTLLRLSLFIMVSEIITTDHISLRTTQSRCLVRVPLITSVNASSTFGRYRKHNIEYDSGSSRQRRNVLDTDYIGTVMLLIICTH